MTLVKMWKTFFTTHPPTQARILLLLLSSPSSSVQRSSPSWPEHPLCFGAPSTGGSAPANRVPRERQEPRCAPDCVTERHAHAHAHVPFWSRQTSSTRYFPHLEPLNNQCPCAPQAVAVRSATHPRLLYFAQSGVPRKNAHSMKWDVLRNSFVTMRDDV